MKRHQILTILLTLLTVTVNGLANVLPLNGLTTAEISDSFPVLFVPAGYVFSIWGIIYIGMVAYAIFQALPAQREDERLARIAPYYWLASIANMVWLFLWHYHVFTLTIVAMGALLLALIAIYQVAKQRTGSENRGFQWAVRVPFSIYLGWISVATIANASQLLYFLEWDLWGLSAPLWTAIMLVVATGLGFAMLARERDITYALVLIWAFVGIAVARGDVPLVATTAWVVSGLLGVGVLVAAMIRV